MDKYLKCRFSIPSLTDDTISCRKCEYAKKNKSECETCDMFKSRYIEYPITISKIENKEISFDGLGHECGTLLTLPRMNSWGS